MKNKKINIRKWMKLSYLVLLVCAISIFVIIYFTKDDSDLNIHDMQIEKIDLDWTLDLEGKQQVELSALGTYMEEETGMISVYYQLPDMSEDLSLIYRSKDVKTRVIIDGEMIYETKVPESPLYNRSPGNLWNVAEINSDYSGKMVELQVFMVYDTNAVTLDNIYLGDESVIILTIIRNKLGGIVISALMLLLGLCMIVVNFISQRITKKQDYGLSYLGLYAVLIGLWSLIETNTMQFFVMDMRILQTLDNMLVVVGVMPLLLYLDCEYKLLDKIFMKVFFCVYLAFILFCIVMQFTGIIDLHVLLPIAMLFLVVCGVVLCVWVIAEYRRQREMNQNSVYQMLRIVGIASLWILTGFEMAQHLKSDAADRATWLRVGMLIFILCFAASNLLVTYKLLEQGMKFEFVKNLAYQDGLTGIGNRTAYLEQLEKFALEKSEQLGIVFMDINNLKVVNDTQGHDLGDEMIKTAADIIEKSFGKVGKVYRIGGDEFCALITTPDTKRVYEDALKLFTQLIKEANAEIGQRFHLQIAQGFSMCEDVTMERIEQTISLADSAMYSDKAKQKGLSA